MAVDPTAGNKLAASAALTIAFPRHEQTFPMLTPAEIARIITASPPEAALSRAPP